MLPVVEPSAAGSAHTSCRSEIAKPALARILLQEGLPHAFARHARASEALVAGLRAMGLRLFGDLGHKMANVTGV